MDWRIDRKSFPVDRTIPARGEISRILPGGSGRSQCDLAPDTWPGAMRRAFLCEWLLLIPLPRRLDDQAYRSPLIIVGPPGGFGLFA
jgi:hypothetical protein